MLDIMDLAGDFFIFGVIATILSIVAVILAFIFIVPEKRKAKLNKFGKFLHNTLNFKYLIIEKLLQALYIFSTAYVLIYGFLMLFHVQQSYYGHSRWSGGNGILLMILGPICVRLVYELLMMAVLAVKNIISVNNKLKNQNDSNAENDPFKAPEINEMRTVFCPQSNDTQPLTYQAKNGAVPNYVYCPNCGNVVEVGTFCSKCGTKV